MVKSEVLCFRELYWSYRVLVRGTVYCVHTVCDGFVYFTAQLYYVLYWSDMMCTVLVKVLSQ